MQIQLFFSELNKDQLDNVAKLCFDLAKIGFAFAFFPAIEVSNPQSLIKVLVCVLIGLAFTYRGLVLLKMKERVSE